MHTLFELKTQSPIDTAVFERMKKTAEAELSKAEKSKVSRKCNSRIWRFNR